MKKTATALFVVFSFWALAASISGQEVKAKPQPKVNPRDFTAHLIGHAHIDLSWLWRWEETVHDIATQTFWGTLAHMEKMPGLTFAQSQAAIYEAVEKNYPDLFQKIRAKVKEGTWIPVGGMWVEPDLNMADGEALARQLLYGKKYFLEKFGVDVKVGWNPDSFGHNWQLPQILSKAGIRYYIFERCAPEKTPIFWWEGVDGSRVLAYVPPGWYLVDLKNGVKDLLMEAGQNTPVKDFMLLYGEGDHGGGPRASDLEAILKFKDDKGHPQLGFINPQGYFQKLELSKLEHPVVKKELNFTFPACYTTQAETKKYNRRLENLMLTAEKFSALAMFSGYRDYYPERDIDEAWKIALRHQFHDIFDGSSIGPVYEETGEYYEEAASRGKRALDFSLETIANVIDTQGEGQPLIVYNSLFWERTEPVEAEVSFAQRVKALKILDSSGAEVPCQIIGEKAGQSAWSYKVIFIAENVPSFGYKTYRIIKSETPRDAELDLVVSGQPPIIENEFLRVTINPETGWIKGLTDKANAREMLSAEGNILQAIVDEPEFMSAWELGLKDTSWNIGEDGAKIEVLESGPVRATVRIKNVFRNSRFTQDLHLYSKVPRLDCRMTMDWQERNLMIKAAFPVAAINSTADFEIPYGFITRNADGTEVPALKWIDVTDESGSHGLSLLNDSKYGFDVKGNILRISIIHGATQPDPEADRGEHELLYSIYPHAGSWREAATFRRGYELNNPLIARVAMRHAGKLPQAHSFIGVEPSSIILSSVKKEMGYYSRALILRFYETFGKEATAKISLPWEVEAWETDLIERPLAKLETHGRMLEIAMKPFEIKTLKIMPKSGR